MRTHQQVFSSGIIFPPQTGWFADAKIFALPKQKIQEISNEIKVLTTRQVMTSA